MQNFEDNYINTDNPIQNFEIMTEQFKNEWIKYCSEKQVTHIKSNFLTDLYIYLQKPLGMGFGSEETDKFQTE